jgi:hypothetical protein
MPETLEGTKDSLFSGEPIGKMGNVGEEDKTSFTRPERFQMSSVAVMGGRGR